MTITHRMFSLSLLVALFACGDDKSSGGEGEGDDDATLLADANAHIDECGLPETERETEIEDELDRCLARCIIDAPCDEFVAFICEESTSGSLITCGAKCFTSVPADGFDCGDGEKVAHLYLCDGDENCANAKDEEGCDDYTCADGEVLPPPTDIECDGSEDCADGSDEAGCPDICGE
jgi:hypothetical protein